LINLDLEKNYLLTTNKYRVPIHENAHDEKQIKYKKLKKNFEKLNNPTKIRKVIRLKTN